jgi:hypothetical protein
MSVSIIAFVLTNEKQITWRGSGLPEALLVRCDENKLCLPRRTQLFWAVV